METQHTKPKLYLLLHNISKAKNYGMLLRSAAAMGCSKIFIITKNPENSKKSKIFADLKLEFGDKGTASKLDYEVFPSIDIARKYFNSNNIKIVGVEITEDSKDISTDPFVGDTVFILGNEGDGLITPLKNICDYLVYIPQYTNKTGSLNVVVAGGIIFHRFAVWAKFEESKIFGEKFVDVENPFQKKFFNYTVHEDDVGENKKVKQD